ncbi:aspartyl protease family protein [Mucilaginibacter boryungensis]|uniref:Retropepsin-like domain-containing protein n=1 Tax=Mucilaginibacter boryungensis TaxID=768480 RepID=A0ABR9XHY3_9SPHI|nr:retropepsin-like aspartic protease [Mucilaginibacter boryungensis]MBE9666670.1 retropepsin-like domain-containing protein [Mucilaginibacter boryungensis]
MNKIGLLLFLLFTMGGRFQANAMRNPQPVHHVSFKNAIVAEPDPEPYGDFKTLIVPFKKAGNLIVIEAQIDSVYGNFILDTGAPCLVLNKTYFRDAPHIEDKDAGGINGLADRSFKTTIKHLSIFELNYDKLSADVCDLSGIENGRNIKILGLLGTRLFNKLAITVDVNQSVLYIHKLDDKGNIPEAERLFAVADVKTPFKLLNDVVYLRCAANDQKLWFAFDTGAESNLIDYSRNKKLVRGMRVISRAKLTGIGNSSFEVITAEFDKLVVGDHEFLKNKAVVTDLDKMGSAYGYSVDAMLGYDFYSRGIFTLNFVKKEFEMYIYNRDNIK